MYLSNHFETGECDRLAKRAEVRFPSLEGIVGRTLCGGSRRSHLFWMMGGCVLPPLGTPDLLKNRASLGDWMKEISSMDDREENASIFMHIIDLVILMFLNP
jgi:hypothetical protein